MIGFVDDENNILLSAVPCLITNAATENFSANAAPRRDVDVENDTLRPARKKAACDAKLEMFTPHEVFERQGERIDRCSR